MNRDPAAIGKMIMQGYVARTPPLEAMLTVKGKVALVTGGSSGLGFCVTQRLLQGGAKVVMASHSESEGAFAMELLQSAGHEGNVQFCRADVTSEADIENLVRYTDETFGSLDILVTCAGLWNYAHVYDMPEKEFLRVIDVNLNGTFRAAKHVSRYMIDHGIKGKMCFVSSNVYTMPGPVFGGYPHYAASKGGIVALTVEIARELKRYGIMVNTVAPGGMGTPGGVANGILRTIPEAAQAELAEELKIGKVDRVPSTDHVAMCVYMMCTPVSDYTTGECFVTDDGMAHNIIYHSHARPEYPPAKQE